MALKKMYPFANSMLSNLSEAINASDGEIKVDDIGFFPPAPNFATIGSDNSAETIFYSGITSDKLTGCVRGQCGTIAKPWDSGLDIYHAFTRDNGNNMIDNIGIVDSRIRGQNLIINGELSVWPRDISFTNPNGVYTTARMICTGGTITKNARGWGMDIVGTTRLQYLAEDIDWKPNEGKTATLSYSKDGVISSGQMTITSRQYVDLTLTDCTLDWLKLELGEVATAMEFRSVGELRGLCQRYYEIFKNPIVYVSTGDIAFADLRCAEKRIIPTVIYSPSLSSVDFPYVGTRTITSKLTNRQTTTSATFAVTFNGAAITDKGTPGIVLGEVWLDAEIY